MGIRLKRAGYDTPSTSSPTGSGGPGGTTLSRGACDVPSHLYSFSFEPNPWWSRTYATQTGDPGLPGAVHRPFRGASPCPDGHLVPRRGGTNRPGWTLTAASGEQYGRGGGERTRACSMCPMCPDLPGAERFAGRSFHSSRWDHSPAGGRPAGGLDRDRGQCRPVRAGHRPRRRTLTVFQRTPIWITPRWRPLLRRSTAPFRPHAAGRPPGPLEDLDDLSAGRTSGPTPS